MSETSPGIQLARSAASAARRKHGDDEVAAYELIDEIIQGEDIWFRIARKLARCEYQLEKGQ